MNKSLTNDWKKFNGQAPADIYDIRTTGCTAPIYTCIVGKDNQFYHIGSTTIPPIPFGQVEMVRKGFLVY